MVKKIALFSIVSLLAAGMPALAFSGEGHAFDLGLFIAKIVNSVIFFGGLAYLLKEPVSKFFRGRRETIVESLEVAEKSREEAARRLEEIEAKMSNLDLELAEIEAQAKQDAERERKRIRQHAQAEAERLLEQATSEIDNMRREALRNLRGFITQLAVDEAERLARDTMTEDERQRLFAGFVERLGAKS